MELLLLSFALVATLSSAAALLAARRRTRSALVLAAAAMAVMLAYAGGIVAVNGRSEVTRIPAGDREAFCGTYLDCHVGLAVAGAEETEVGGRPVRVVTLSLSSDAGAEAIAPPVLSLLLVDSTGRAYPRSREAERSLGLAPDLAAELEPGGSRAARVAFEVPPGAPGLVLRAALGDPVARVAEALLIGDTDGLLHAPVVHEIGG